MCDHCFSILEDEEINDISENKKPSTGTSWGSSRLPPSVAGPNSISPKKSPNKSPASSNSNTPDASPVKVNETHFVYDCVCLIHIVQFDVVSCSTIHF